MFPSLYHGNECIKTYNFKMILLKSVYHIIFISVLQISGTYQMDIHTPKTTPWPNIINKQKTYNSNQKQTKNTIEN